MRKTEGQPLPLGVTVSGERINFSTVVPGGKTCRLLIYPAGEKTPCKIFDMQESLGDVRYIALEDIDSRQYEYNYEIDGEVTPDDYGKAFAGRSVWGKERDVSEHEVRGVLFQEEYDWEGDRRPFLSKDQVIAYSLHVRGFTKDTYSKVSAKGTFEGIVEKLPYLKDLGINQIQCMPIYEFEECGRIRNYWGYGEAYYFAPKSAYAAGKSPVKALKDLVKACHKEGIEVVLEMPFAETVSALTVIECLRYYMIEYHVDGFVLNAYADTTKAAFSDPILKSAKILTHRTDFQNVMRRFLKGDEGMVEAVIYWLKHMGKEEGSFNYIASHSGFTLNDLVSYDGKHNESNGENNRDGTDYNFSWNCGAEGPSRKKSVCSLRKRQIRNALFLVFLAQGMPCILAGDEFGNSQNGNNNVYCQDNPVGWVNWRGFQSNKEQYEFVKRLIALRKKYKVFHPEHEMTGIDSVSCGVPDVSYHGESAWRTPSEVCSRQLGVYYSGAALKGEDCYVIYNMHWLSHTFALPSLPKGKKWYKIASTDDGILEEPRLSTEQKALETDARTIIVLAAR